MEENEMNRLIQTELFSILEKDGVVFTGEKSDIAPAYDDFMRSVISLCTSAKEGIPAYFTLHYTRLKLEELQILPSDKKAKKKCADIKLHRPVSFIY